MNYDSIQQFDQIIKSATKIYRSMHNRSGFKDIVNSGYQVLTIHLVWILFRIFVVLLFLFFLLPDVCLYYHLKMAYGDFSGGPVVKNLHRYARDTGSIPGQGTRIPHAVEQLSSCSGSTEPKCSGVYPPRPESPCAATET